ncbi:sigma 54-interacting transcriptional regulator [Alkaliphilus crotonatoxidans]
MAVTEFDDHLLHSSLEKKLKSLTGIFPQGEVNIVEEEIYYNTAKNFGSRLNIQDYDTLIEKMARLGIGKIRINLISDEKIIVQLFECFTCHDMEYLGKAMCYFEGGILAGAISQICGQEMDAVETHCVALGNNYCQFELTPRVNHDTTENGVKAEAVKKEDSIMDLTLHSLRLAKNYTRAEHKTKYFYDINLRLNKALKRALEINSFNETILDSFPHSLALIDRHGVIIKINKQYRDFLDIDFHQVEKKNIQALGWSSQYQEVLKTGNNAIWHETLGGKEYIIFESPVYEGMGILRQFIPIESDFVKLLLDKISYLEREMNYYKHKVMEREQPLENLGDLSMDSQKMKELSRYVKKVAKTDATILLRGESGTGKSMLAEIIHRESLRRLNPFVCIDCTTIPKDFFEAELFGYEPGAYTGANKNGKAGKLELADGGTIFLDEVGEIPLEAQAKLLRFLQERKFEQLGGVTTKKVDVRIIAATNQDLERMVQIGQFRRDLYYRLNVINVAMPPLRERWEEIPRLTHQILFRFCREIGIELKEVHEDGIKELIHYDWPGNIRELENLLKRLAINVDNQMITRRNILDEISAIKNIHSPDSAQRDEINDSEKQLIIGTLQKYNFNKTLTAEKLGITRQTLYNKIKRYQINC